MSGKKQKKLNQMTPKNMESGSDNRRTTDGDELIPPAMKKTNLKKSTDEELDTPPLKRRAIELDNLEPLSPPDRGTKEDLSTMEIRKIIGE